jgi:hypothetical protein
MYRFFHKDGDHGHHHDHDHKDPQLESKQPIIPPKTPLRFEDFLKLFPPVELPLSITSDTQRMISEVQEPMSAAWMANFVLDEGEIDEYTEFMPCFSIPNTDGFFAIIYWQASLEGNAYFVATFNKAGILIDHRLIAGSLYLEDGMTQLVCTIGADWSISRVEGKLGTKGEIIKNENPEMTYLQVTLDGEIIEG